MNDQTTELLSKLADKLGTTSEYLWQILLKQAQISAITMTVYVIIVITAMVILFKVHKKFSAEGEKGYCYYEEHDWIVPVMSVLSLILIIIAILVICSLETIIYGFFNPEYWALKEILKAIE